MKILFITPSAQLGGAERMLLDLIGSLRGQSMHLLAMEDGPLIEAAGNLGVTVTIAAMPKSLAQIGDSGAAWWKLALAVPYAMRLRRIVRAIKPDVIHANGIKAQLLSRLVAGDATLIWHVHDLIGNRVGAKKLLLRFSSRVDCAIAVSRAVESDLKIALPHTPVEFVLNAIDVDHFSPGDAPTAELDRWAGFEHRENAIRIGLVSTYARWKGHEVFIDACAKALARSDRPDLRFFIIGGPIYSTRDSQFTRNELRDRVERLGITQHVGFVKFLPDPVEAYRALDVVVHASTSPEPFGRTIAEAMACERAVIATRGGGTEELITNQRDGLIVEPRDSDALAAAMLGLARDPARRDALATAARKTAAERFDRRRLGPQMLAIYSQHR